MEHDGYELGMLATVEGGNTRLRPLELSTVDGELWAAVSGSPAQYPWTVEGRQVDLVLLTRAGNDRVRGFVKCSTAACDRERLWTLQSESLTDRYTGADDPRLVVLKIIPSEEDYGEDAELRRAA